MRFIPGRTAHTAEGSRAHRARIAHRERFLAGAHELPRLSCRRHPRSPRGRTQEPRATARAVDSGLWVLEPGAPGSGSVVDLTAGRYSGESSRGTGPTSSGPSSPAWWLSELAAGTRQASYHPGPAPIRLPLNATKGPTAGPGPSTSVDGHARRRPARSGGRRARRRGPRARCPRWRSRRPGRSCRWRRAARRSPRPRRLHPPRPPA
jgi:hypothetical protein